MNQKHDTPAPPSEPAWDITFTRMAHTVLPKIEACAIDLARRFKAMGLSCDTHVRPMPRGLSTFLTLVGQRGLICIVEMTLVDGMVDGNGPCTGLEISLLDACGDVVDDGLISDVAGRTFLDASAAETLIAQNLDRAATGIYVATLGHFELLQPLSRHA
jgi:hypothetical protein